MLPHPSRVSPLCWEPMLFTYLYHKWCAEYVARLAAMVRPRGLMSAAGDPKPSQNHLTVLKTKFMELSHPETGGGGGETQPRAVLGVGVVGGGPTTVYCNIFMWQGYILRPPPTMGWFLEGK